MPEESGEQEVQSITKAKEKKVSKPSPETVVVVPSESHDQEKIAVIREELQTIQEKRQELPGPVVKIAQRYYFSPQPMFGESAGTSQSFLQDHKKYGTAKALIRLVNRVGIMAKAGDAEIFKKEISNYEVPLKTKIRGAAIVALSTPYMLAQAFRINHPVARKIIGLFNPYPRLFTKEARARYTPPPEFTSGTFDSRGRLIKR